MIAASPALNLARAAPSPSGVVPIAVPGDGHTVLPGDFSDLLDVGEGAESLAVTDDSLATDMLDKEPPPEGEEQPHGKAASEATEAMLSAAMTTVQWTVGVERALQLAMKPAAATWGEPVLFVQGTASPAMLRGNQTPIQFAATTPTLAEPAVPGAALTAMAANGQDAATTDAAGRARAPRFELPPMHAGAGPASAPANATGNGFVLDGGSVRLPPGDTSVWQRPLAQALGDRLQMQASQGVEQARIRLEPPALGRIEIVLRQEGNQLQVQLSASHTDVVRQLLAMGEGLRQELSQKQGTQVSVQVFEDPALAAGRNPQRERQQQQQEDHPGQGLMSESNPDRREFTLA